MDLKTLIRSIPDYPKPGILFRDITTLIENPQGFRQSIEDLAERHRGLGVTHVAGIEARGFIFGAGVAIALGVGFVPVRKKGKLPFSTVTRDYALEYGTAAVEIHTDACRPGQRVLILDDLIATGGTLVAATHLFESIGAVVAGVAAVIDLPELGGSAKLRNAGYHVHTLCAFNETE